MNQDEINHLLRTLFVPGCDSFREACWKPAADVYQTRGGWLLKFELAGVPLDDVDIEVSGRRVTVSGVRRDWSAEEGMSLYRMEIAYSQFRRTIELPADIESAHVERDHRNGMLIIRLGTKGG